MKVLIAYDDSDCAKDALEDLKNAGFPAQTEALVLTVTENWSLIFEAQEKELSAESRDTYPIPAQIRHIREKAHEAFAETERKVRIIAQNLQTEFPSWSVDARAMPGFAHWDILETARTWEADLIVIGSHGRNLIGRVLLGSSSLKVLTEAECSVRIGRIAPSRTSDDDSPQRIIVGFDGSEDSKLAVEAVARRAWRQDSAVRLVSAIEPILVAAPGFDIDFEKVSKEREVARHRLEAAGLHVSSVEHIGDPKSVLLREMEIWGADAIFIGARGHRFLERILLGSVSYAIAARAQCSVEIIRKKAS